MVIFIRLMMPVRASLPSLMTSRTCQFRFIYKRDFMVYINNCIWDFIELKIANAHTQIHVFIYILSVCAHPALLYTQLDVDGEEKRNSRAIHIGVVSASCLLMSMESRNFISVLLPTRNLDWCILFLIFFSSFSSQ